MLRPHIVRWASQDTLPIEVTGTGLVHCHLYELPGRMILHLINLTSEATWRAPVDELIRVGPFQVSVRLPSTVRARSAQLLVAGGTRALRVSNGMATFTIDSILDHEVAVIE